MLIEGCSDSKPPSGTASEQFVEEECLVQNLNATPQFIGALTELIYASNRYIYPV